MTSVLSLLGRGAVAGAAAGLLSGGFSYLLVEPVIDRAVDLQAVHQAAEHTTASAEIFSRSTQHIGLIVSATAVGLALGALFGVVYAFVHRRDPGTAAWTRSQHLAAAAFTGIWLLPFLRYPANPPGVGDPGTIDQRTDFWLAALGISLIAVVLAWNIHRRLAVRSAGAPARQLAVAGILIAAVAALFALPANPDAVTVPAKLLWEFRLWSVATSVLLWGTLGLVFGLLGQRAGHLGGAAGPAVTAPAAGALV
ncbi:CbtA family protein [Streptomyces sp. NL15-2K]|uniref:CbtA family protein n=1 Tax=Streptomyces sp. NL15-2K TaxID=376149 RepID=UPI00209C63C9|nr:MULTISPECIES: CbtA family protein [Actinomycetes]WKX09299.1 CbtA family protein [Kutzneria buriramensis]